MKKKYAIGADIGGSHISSVLVDLENNRMIAGSLSEQKVDNQASAEEILTIWSDTLRKTMHSADTDQLAGIGFAMPGPFDYVRGISLMKNVAKYDNLYGVHIGEELGKMLGLPESIPFRYMNDALSFAVGECWSGKASRCTETVAVTLGTGLGSAFLSRGIPVIEGDRVPEMGYLYHIPYEKGIADEYFSTRWLVAEYALRTGKTCSGVKEIAMLASTDQAAQELLTGFGHDLGMFLSPFLKRFGADCLILGGNITGAYPWFGPELEDAMKGCHVNVFIYISELMESAAMLGSARLLDETFWKEIKPIIAKI